MSTAQTNVVRLPPRTKLDHALELAAQNRRVIPLHPNGKRPIPDEWQKLATTDTLQIEKWWRQWPEANVGHVLKADEVVIDNDPRNGGNETLEQLEWDGYDLPETREHRTASGGTHKIYKSPPGVKLKKDTSGKVLGPGLDLLTKGAQIVSVGSVVNGTRYEVSNKAPIAYLPEWIIKRAVAASGKSTPKSPEELLAPSPERVRQAVERIPNDDVGWGEYNTMLMAIWAASGGTDIESAHAWASKSAKYNPANVNERWSTYPSCPPNAVGWSRLLDSARRADPVWAADGLEAVDIFADTPLQPDAGEQAVSNETPDDDEPASDSGDGEASSEQPKRGLYSISFAEACQRTATHKLQPLVKDWLLCGSSIVVFGDSNTGKTFMVLDVCYHVAAGLPWAGLPVTQGGVLYVAAEGGNGIYHRLEALRLKHGNADVPFRLAPCSIDLRTTSKARDWIIHEIQKMERDLGCKVRLVVIDTLARALNGGQESSSEHMGALIGNMDRVRQDTDVAFLFIHHSGKDQSKGGRGWSGLKCAIDTEIAVTENGKGTKRSRAKATKQKDLESDKMLDFRLNVVRTGTDDDGNPITSCTVEVLTGSADGFEIPLTKAEQEFHDALVDKITREAELADVPIEEFEFDWMFAARALQEARSEAPAAPKGARKRKVHPTPKRQSISRKCTELVDKKRAVKIKPGQWVIRCCT